MRPVRIEFIEQQRWQEIWICALAVCTLMIAALALQWMRARQDIESQGQDRASMQAEVQRLQAPATVKPDPRQSSNKQLLQVLNLDLSGVFAAAENLKISGARLTGINLDAAADKLQLDYEVESLSKAAEVTELLNAGNEARPWKMGRISSMSTISSIGSSNSSNFSVSPSVSRQTEAFQAVWMVSISALSR